MCKILIDNRDGCRTICSAAIPFPVRQSKCAWMLERITTKTTFRNRLWIAAQEIEIPNQTHTWHPLKPGVSACLALSYATCQTDSQVICISSHCLFEVKWSEYLSSAGFTVGSSICSHHTGALCIRQVIVVVISLLLPELWPLGSFLFCPRITSLKFLSCSPCAVPPFELYSGGAVVPTIASVMSWFSNPKFRRIFLETFYGDFWPFLLVFSTKVGNSRAKAEISLEE